MESIWGKWRNLMPGSFIISNLPIIIALILLASAPIFILYGKNDIANQYAGYAFYFLIAGILWKVIQSVINRYSSKDNVPVKSP